MSSDEDFDDAAYKEYEDQLYHDESSSVGDDDVDSEVEEALYSQVHYASSLLVSENSTPGGERKAQKENSDGLRTTRQQRFHLNSSVIVISSDDNENDKVKGHDSDGDSVEELCSTSIKYPEVIEIFSDENTSTPVRKNREMQLKEKFNGEEPGKLMIENWDLDERDLEDSTKRKRPRYYTPDKGNPYTHLRCYNCNEKGHLVQFCPQPKKISVCFLCGDSGHIKRNCPYELCFNCKEPGHISKQCKEPRVRRFDRCNRCHILGHFERDCPDRWRQYHLTTQVGPIIRPDRPLSPILPVYCYNCGRQGHYGYQCSEENSLRKGQLPFPFVVCYDGCPVSTSHREENYTHREKRPRYFRELDSEQSFNHSREDHGTAECIYEPPSRKYLKLNDDGDYVRRDDARYHSREPNAMQTDLKLLKRKNRNKRRRKKKEAKGSNERTVELIYRSFPDHGLIEEPNYTKKEKLTKRKRWHFEETSQERTHSNISNAPKKSKHDKRRYTNAHHKNNFRSFEDRDFDTRKTSYHPRKGGKDVISNRGFRFNDQSHGKKSNPHFIKPYTF